MSTRWTATAGVCFCLATIMGLAAAYGGEVFRRLCIDGYCVKWSGPSSTEPRTLTWAIASRDVVLAEAFNCQRMQPPADLLRNSGLNASEFRRALAAAFSLWQDVANIDFREIDDQDSADIVIGEQAEPSGYAFTNVTLDKDGGTGASITRAQICLNPGKRWKIGYDGNLAVYDLVHTFAHEIGHAIGLDHPDARGHLMSFRYDESVGGLSSGDVLGATALYGPRRDRSAVVLTSSSPR